MKNYLFILAAAALIVGCQKESKSEKFEYDFTYNGCPTGKKSFGSRDEMCSALQNNSLNNHCAQDMRRQHFSRECPGKTFTAF